MADPVPDPTRRDNSTEDDDEVARPFTDFGQFGPGWIDKRVLYQDIYWVDTNGRPHFITDMPTDYLKNVIAFLHREAPVWWLAEVVWVSADVALNDEHPTLARHILERLQELGPERWMEDTRLVRRIRAELDRRNGPGPGADPDRT
jgi:hypothetical protein